MSEIFVKFSCRADMVCPQSDPAKRMHFLSWRSGFVKPDGCFICRSKGNGYNSSKNNLHCETCDFDVHSHCFLQTRCRMSDLAKPHNLQKIDGSLSFCSACQGSTRYFDDGGYYCAPCEKEFHEGCHLYPPEIKHPFHPLHPLKFTFSSSKYSYSDLYQSIDLPSSVLCTTSYKESYNPDMSAYYDDEDQEDESNDDESNNDESNNDESNDDESNDNSISDTKCNCCQKKLGKMYYHCSVCKFNLNLTCTLNPPPLTLISAGNHGHTHTFTFLPRRIPFPCDACGSPLNDPHDHVYTCHLCNHMVHKTCIYLPRVIKITRHIHRLSLSASLPSGLFVCGVCRRPINVTSGQFSCVKGCKYAVHSRCAVKEKVWDGIDFEGVPEDPDEYKDMEPFVRIDDKTIQHFSHAHHLKFQNNNDVCDEKKFCHACILPVMTSEDFYSCIQCDFLLHEVCASLPRKKDNPLHKHPLFLHPVPYKPLKFQMSGSYGPCSLNLDVGLFRCNGCDQTGCGFMYQCNKRDCKFELDIRCASLPDPITHGSHSHELFFNFTNGECMGCKSSKCSPFSLECMQCKSFLGLKCASLPSLIHYKHDKHPLTLCYGEQDISNGQYWCEICEAKLDAKKWFYKCEEYCNVTVHISCLLGKDIFMKPMSLNILNGSSVLRNNGNTLVVCRKCHRRSTDPFLFQVGKNQYCSIECSIGKPST